MGVDVEIGLFTSNIVNGDIDARIAKVALRLAFWGRFDVVERS